LKKSKKLLKVVRIQGKLKSFIKNKIPKKIQDVLWEVFFLYTPVALLKRVKISYTGYIQKHIPQKGDIVIDGGAYEGNFTILASRLVGKTGKVICFEPEKNSYQKLIYRAKKLNLKNVLVLNFALWDKKETLTFRYQAEGESHISKLSENEKTETSVINGISIDEAKNLLKLKQIDFIKMDIEGAEIEALRGAQQTLADCNVYLTIASYHIREGQRTSKRVATILREYGYVAELGYPHHLTTYAWKNRPN
jgi:FkbM family methyltransferase